MAFLAKQFMSLLLLLIISRLILSTHAGRQHFSQFGRMTTTTTTDTIDPTDKKPDKYGEFQETQPAFYANDVKPHGLGTQSPPSTPTSFLPSNYDPRMYTTSRETQKNMYANQNEDQTVAEKYGAYNNPFSNSKYDEQYNAMNKKPTTTVSKKQTEEPNGFYYQDTSSNLHNNQQTQSSKPFYNQRYNQNNQFPQEDEPAEAKNYDPFSSTKSSQQQYIEAEEEKKKNTPTTEPESYKYNPFQAYDPTESKKQSNSKFSEQYANEDAELDALLNDPQTKHGASNIPSNKFSKNSAPAANSYWNTKDTNTNNEWSAYYQKQQQEKKNEWPSAYDQKQQQETKNEWPSAYDQKQQQKTKNEWPSAYDQKQQQETKNEWPGYDQKQGKDNKHFAMTDADLNAILDEEDIQGEDEIELESPPQGMSDTRLPTNKQYYSQSTYNWKEHANEFANAFSGNALSIAAQNNP